MTTRAMPYTYDDIIFQYDASKYMLRRQIITRAEHNRTIRTLNAEQEKRDLAEQLRQLAVRTAEAEKRKAEKRKAYNQRRKEQRAKPKSKTASVEPFKQTMMRWLNGEEKENESLRFELPEDMLQRIQLKDKMTVQFDLVNGSDVLDSFSTTVNGKDISSIVHHYNYSDKVIGLKTDKKSQTRSITSMADIIMRSSDLRMTVFQPVVAKMKKQAFRDGVHHCVFQPIIKHFEELVKEATVTKTKRNRQAIVNKLEKMVVQYDGGVPEELVESVAYELDIGIIIHSLSQHVLMVANVKPKNKVFHFINTRLNHVEYLTIDMNSEAVMITKEEGIDLITDHIKNRLYNYYTGTITNPRTILTTTKRYIVGDKLSTALFDFTKSFDRGCMLDYIREKELCDFILSGTHLMINFKNKKCKGSPVAEIDMKKAYTQFNHCSVYQGFPAIINNVRDCDSNHDVVTHNGVYQVSIVSMVKTIQNAKQIELLHAYGFKENGSYVLASPWIVKLREIGCIVHVLFGAWGKRMDFSFSQEMMDEKLYAIWTGMQMKRDDELHFKMACDSEFAEVVMAQHTEGNVEYNQATQTIMINKKKDYHYIMPHVSAFLVAYTQISVFDEASKYHVSEIVAHKLDSIVLTRTPLPFDSTLWEDSTSEGIPMNKYTSNFIFSENNPILTRGKLTNYLGDCFISGPGGCGKTEIIMRDIGFRSKLFVTLSWDLISDKMVEYSCRGASINQLLGFDIYNKKIQSYKDKFGSPGVIAFDEASMTNKRIRNRTIAMYPYSQLIMMGDYDKGKYYQSSLLTEGDELYHPESYHLITSDFRSIDEETRVFKKEIRSLMDNNESLVGYLYSKIPSLSMEEIKKEYSMDYMMTGTHARIAYFTKELSSDKNWYKVTKHNFDDVIKKCAGSKDVYLHGQVLDFPIEGRTELTHAFTVHSFQGKTITDKKCYVDLSHLKCNADIYTAVSRVRSIHQLRLVRSEYSSVMFSNGVYFYKN
jgi:hypothetical protein